MKQMAIMKHVVFGVDDRGKVSLRFSSYIEEGLAALQIIEGDDALGFIGEYGVSDVTDLNDKPCWVERDGMIIRFIGACNI